MAETTEHQFTDRESGTYAGLMLSLRKYADRLIPYPAYQLNKKPREIDCVIIDKTDSDEVLDNDIARIFAKHNIVELKNPYETLNVNTVWKVISYAAQYKSEGNGIIRTSDVTITLLRAAKPTKALKDLAASGYRVQNSYPGIYYISGMVDFRTQIVVTRELEGDEFAPLRIQRKNADREDYRRFLKSITASVEASATGYIEMVLKYGIYDERTALRDAMEELTKEGTDMKKKMSMYDELMLFFKDDIDKQVAEGEARGEARGEAERKRLTQENARLQEENARLRALIPA